MASPTEGFARVLATLDRLEIQYLVGGSVASSFHGIPRTTMDVDIVADIDPDQVSALVEALQGEFYADEEMIRQALRLKRAFNLIHLRSSYKFDIFPLRSDAYSQASFARRRFAPVDAVGGEPIECALASPEDTILRKLEWYRAGGESSERQWNDLRGVVRVQEGRLDLGYLRQWADFLKIRDLLEKLLAE